jgi:Helix-turn-helix domain
MLHLLLCTRCACCASARAQTYANMSQSVIATNRAAFSPGEFAAACGRHPSWAYRLLYSGKIKAVTGLGRILIPASELDRVLESAEPYNPQPGTPKTDGI